MFATVRPSRPVTRRARHLSAVVAAAFVATACTAGGGDGTGAAALPGPPADGDAVADGITVTGAGVASGEPDVVEVTVGVGVRSAEVQDALDRANAATADVLAALDEQGVAEEDRQTVGFSVFALPAEEDAPDGYEVSNRVVATVRDVDTVGAVIQAATEAAGDDARVDGIRFDLEDDGDQVVAAREAALADAREKAAQYAELAGAELGDLVGIEDRTVTSPRQSGAEAADAADDGVAMGDVPIETGEQDVTVQVVTRWTLAG